MGVVDYWLVVLWSECGIWYFIYLDFSWLYDVFFMISVFFVSLSLFYGCSGLLVGSFVE